MAELTADKDFSEPADIGGGATTGGNQSAAKISELDFKIEDDGACEQDSYDEWGEWGEWDEFDWDEFDWDEVDLEEFDIDLSEYCGVDAASIDWSSIDLESLGISEEEAAEFLESNCRR